MTWAQILLLLAIVIVFLAWRRARSQVREMRLRIDQHREANTFTIEPSPDGADPRLEVLDAAGSPVDPAVLSWDEHGLEHLTAQLHAAAPPLLPGTQVELVRGAQALEVWSATMDQEIGTLDGAAGARVGSRLESGEIGSCVVLRQAAPGGRLDLLLIHAAVDIDL